MAIVVLSEKSFVGPFVVAHLYNLTVSVLNTVPSKTNPVTNHSTDDMTKKPGVSTAGLFLQFRSNPRIDAPAFLRENQGY